jgi:hypothetical protein
MDNVGSGIFFERRAGQPRMRQAGVPWDLPQKGSMSYIRLHSYSVRVIEKWIALSADVKSLASGSQCLQKGSMQKNELERQKKQLQHTNKHEEHDEKKLR